MTTSDTPATTGKPSLAARIDQEKSHPLAWKTVAKRAAVAAVAGVTIYLVFPAITEVLASWPRLSTLDPWWLLAAIAAEVAHFAARSRCSAWRCGPGHGSRSSPPRWPATRSPSSCRAARRSVPRCSSGCWRPAAWTPPKPWAA